MIRFSITLFLGSILSYLLNLDAVALVLAVLALFGLFVMRRYGLIALFFIYEIIIGSHGILLSAGPVSMRKILFAGICLLAIIMWRKVVTQRVVLIPALLFIVWVVSATLRGAMLNGATQAIDDADGYAYLLLLPIAGWLSSLISGFKIKNILQTGGAIISIVSLTVAFLFTHLPGDILDGVYTFLRDRRLFEITLRVIGDVYWFRIFSPAMLFVAFAALVSLVEKNWKPLGLFGATLLISESRTLWLAVAIAAFVLLLMERNRLKELFKTFIKAVMITVPILLLMFIPPRPDLTDAAFFETSAQVGRSEAVVSRWVLLDEMNTEIVQSPIFGHGLGETVEYKSSDPRQNGVYETYRFEWGYQDIMLKMGILGLLLYLWILAAVGSQALQQKNSTALAGLVLIMVAHTFSPYLNHPIGIMGVVFVLLMLHQESEQVAVRSS
jgi:hypothetical protein